MEQLNADAQELREQVARAEAKLKALKEQLANVENGSSPRRAGGNGPVTQAPDKPWKWPLKADEYERYGRQLVLPGVGVEG